MAREKKQFSWRRVLVLLFLVLVWGGLLVSFFFDHQGRRAPVRVSCMNNLRQLGGLMSLRVDEDRLELLSGSDLLKQLATDIRDEDLDIFVCPGNPRYPRSEDHEETGLLRDMDDLVECYRADWRTAPCSYRGPDAELLAEAFGPDAPRLIIACDLNGSDGSDPYHSGGVVVLYNDARVDFIRWEKMEGYAAGPVKVGPGSPDPRFRRLIP